MRIVRVVNICARLLSFIEGVVILLIGIRVSSFHEGFASSTTKRYTETQSPGPPFCVDTIGGFSWGCPSPSNPPPSANESVFILNW